MGTRYAHGLLLPALAGILAACTPPVPASPPIPQSHAERRAIFVSFDALSETLMRETIDSAVIPNFHWLFDSGACAKSVRPAFPSVTAPGHASLWTGAYGDVNGIAANNQPELPRSEHSLHDWSSGFSSAALRAEPIWVTAGDQGVSVVGHHPTQAPHAPGYPSIDGAPSARLDSLRSAAHSVLARPTVHVVNGYNREIARSRVLDERRAAPREAAGWRNVQRLNSGVTPLEIAWAVGDDSVFALLHGATSYSSVLVSGTRDANPGQSVLAHAAPAERAPPAGRELARHFSDALELPVDSGRVFVRVRLFELAADGSGYLIFIPELRVVEGNRPEVSAAYDDAVRGWYGNGASWLLSGGELGAPLWSGGDGTAEARYVESVELVTRQFMAGSEWAWQTMQPRLQLDYYPMIDEMEHSLYAYVERAVPAYDASVARRVQSVREAVWALADMRLGALRQLIANDPDAALFVSGDHGMRASWLTFRPNAALRDAGLLAVDSAGQIDLSRTRALSTNGYYIVVNRQAWRDGIVAPAEESEVMDLAESAIRAARDGDGRPVVTAIWRPSVHDSLGLGGPVGGDLYYEVAPGYQWTREARGPAAGPGPLRAGHGYPSVAPDMQTVFCAAGAGIVPRRIGAARTIDAAPTVSEWLGMRPPLHSVGRSLLGDLLGR